MKPRSAIDRNTNPDDAGHRCYDTDPAMSHALIQEEHCCDVTGSGKSRELALRSIWNGAAHYGQHSNCRGSGDQLSYGHCRETT